MAPLHKKLAKKMVVFPTIMSNGVVCNEQGGRGWGECT